MAEGGVRPRVLLLTRNFPPLLGGMERLNWHLAEELGRCCAVRLVAPAGSAARAPQGVAVHEVPLQPLRTFLVQATLRARREARSWRPDWVLAGSGLMAPAAWWAAGGCGARCAAYVHGLDLSLPHPVYRALWHPLLRRMDRVIANSRATASLARSLGIASQRVTIVHPGTELPQADAQARLRFRLRHGLDAEAPLLLSVGRLTERKGLRQFVAEVLPRIVQQHPGAVLAVVGDAPEHALYAQAQSPRSILQAAQAAGTEANVRLLGKLEGRPLHDAYFSADLHVFPIREIANDIEGFGMVSVEAAAHGLATVAYACGGVFDAVSEGVSGRLVAPGDAAGFARAVLDVLERPLPADGIRGFAEAFAWERFGARITEALQCAPAC